MKPLSPLARALLGEIGGEAYDLSTWLPSLDSVEDYALCSALREIAPILKLEGAAEEAAHHAAKFEKDFKETWNTEYIIGHRMFLERAAELRAKAAALRDSGGEK